MYKQSETLIYIDPPYLGHEGEYRYGVDYGRLVNTLHNATAKVIVSEYPEAGPYFKSWRCIEKVTAKRGGGDHSRAGRKKHEILYCNW